MAEYNPRCNRDGCHGKVIVIIQSVTVTRCHGDWSISSTQALQLQYYSFGKANGVDGIDLYPITSIRQ